jgi:hypothetical protein
MGMDRYAKDMAYSALIASGATAKTRELVFTWNITMFEKNFTILNLNKKNTFRKGMTALEASTILSSMPINDTVIKRICPLNVIADCIPVSFKVKN